MEATSLLLTAVTQEKQAQADQLRAIVSLAHNYAAAMGTVIDDALLDELVEHMVTGGSSGTPPISEFAHLELGPLLGCSPNKAKTILFEALNLYHRHPRLWDAVQDLTLDAHRARRAAGKFGVLPPHLADTVGTQWATRQNRLSWQGAIDLCDTLIVAADPQIAAQREARQLRNRDVRIWEHHEATINLTAKLDVLDAKYLDATVTQLAGILQAKPAYATVALDVLRSKALGIMAHPALALSMIQEELQQPLIGDPPHTPAQEPGVHGPDANAAPGGVLDLATGRINSAPQHCPGHACGAITVPPTTLQPRVQVYIHVHPDGTVTIENVGAVAAATLAELLDGKRVKATPVIDLNTIPAQHQYRPGHQLQEATHLVWRKEAFPFSNRTSRGLDLDHTTAYRSSCRDPLTRLDNLAPFGRRIHRAKTAGFWTCQQPNPGQLIWTSPLGYRYTVDKDGTRRLE